jgi:hypothetical protein
MFCPTLHGQAEKAVFPQALNRTRVSDWHAGLNVLYDLATGH